MPTPYRVACLRIPTFPIAAVVQTEGRRAAERAQARQGALFERPAASVATRAPEPAVPAGGPVGLTHGRIVRAVNRDARVAGVQVGMPVPEARATCATVALHAWDEHVIQRAVARVTAALIAASPDVTAEPGVPGVWWVGATGFEALGGEAVLAAQLQAIGAAWDAEARVAVAGSCVAAYAATWGPGEAATAERTPVVLVPPGGDAAFLAPKSLRLIPMDVEMRDALWGLGLDTLGALAALPSAEVERRWGAVGLDAWRLARAEDPRGPGRARAEAVWQVEREFGGPVGTVGLMLGAVTDACAELVAHVVEQGVAIGALTVTVVLDDGRDQLSRHAAPRYPTQSADALAALVRTALEQWALPAPAAALRLRVAQWVAATGEQGALFDDAAQSARARDRALAEIRSTWGAAAVVRAQAVAAHPTGARATWEPLGEVAAGPSVLPPSGAARRRLDPPEPVTMTLDRGRPVGCTWRGRAYTVQEAHGPDRASGGWWSDTPFDREDWRLDTDGPTFFVAMDRRAGGAWMLLGWLD